MKNLFLTGILLVGVSASAMAQMGVPNGGGNGVPVGPPAIPPTAKAFEIENGGGAKLCEPGRGALLSLTITDAKGRRVVLLDKSNQPITAETPTTAYGFKLDGAPQGTVRGIMICGVTS